MTTGRVDIHSHLIPGMDDGCANVEQTITCARALVSAGYTHAFCTPHIWSQIPENSPAAIAERTAEVQARLDGAGIPLRVMPGGELCLHPQILTMPREGIVTYGMQGEACLFELWADELPEFFEPAVRYLKGLGLTLILAHPERMRATQGDPAVIDRLQGMGLLLQGNLQCFSDPTDSASRRTAERFLAEGRYFCLATDMHRPDTVSLRLQGLRRAIELAGHRELARLTIENPRTLLAE